MTANRPIAELPADWRRLVDEARAAMAKAYAPYSRFQVGSCLEDEQGKLWSGCNVDLRRAHRDREDGQRRSAPRSPGGGGHVVG